VVESKYEDPRPMRPVAKIWINSNYMPEVPPSDTGMQRRLLLIPWDQTFGDRGDETLREKLEAELPGVALWLIAGAVEYLRDGLQIPDAVKVKTASFWAENDALQRFLEDEAEFMAARPNRENFIFQLANWCRDQGVEVQSYPDVRTHLLGKGYEFKKAKLPGGGVETMERRWISPSEGTLVPRYPLEPRVTSEMVESESSIGGLQQDWVPGGTWVPGASEPIDWLGLQTEARRIWAMSDAERAAYQAERLAEALAEVEADAQAAFEEGLT
jgi:phage/plasmid-associated DNA primase